MCRPSRNPSRAAGGGARATVRPMASTGQAPDDDRRRVGRPARINRQMIAEAAHTRGLDGLTLRDVADELGVSIAALYHHVSSKDDLLRLAAEYSAARVPLPVDRDQHWAVWLYEWASYNRRVFVAQPGLLVAYLDGAISPQVVADNVEAILGLLVRQGFSVRDAHEAYETVVSCAVGTAVMALRERQAAALFAPGPDGTPAVFAGHDLLGRLAGEIAAQGRVPFHARVCTVLRGVVTGRGEDWPPIRALLDEAHGGDVPAP